MLNFSNLFGRGRSSNKNRSKASKARELRLESLEARELLAVTCLEYADIVATYPELGLPANMGVLNIDDIQTEDLSMESLNAAITKAKGTVGDDLIVVRTTDKVNSLKYTDPLADPIAINGLSNGSITILAYGDSPLTIDANKISRVISIGANTEAVKLANLTLIGGDASSATLGPNAGGAVYVGGVYNAKSEVLITNCSLTENSASQGGGLYVSQYADVDLMYSDVYDNVAFQGGGFYNAGDLNARNVSITENHACAAAGAQNAVTGTLLMVNTLVADNVVDPSNCCPKPQPEPIVTSDVGGFDNEGNAKLVNCTVVKNDANGIYNHQSAYMELQNTIIVMNKAADIVSEGTLSGYNCLSSYKSWAKGCCSGNLTYSSSKALFVSAATGDYRLASNSQVKDKGKNAYAEAVGLTATSFDLGDMSRFVGKAIDVGAYEYQEIPAAPTNVTWKNYDYKTGTVTINWKDNSKNEEGFIVEYRINDAQCGCTCTCSSCCGEWSEWIPFDNGYVRANTKTLKVSGLLPNVKYEFRVVAYNAMNLAPSVASAVLNTQVPKVAAPSGVSFKNYSIGCGKVTVTWIDNATDETGYIVSYHNGCIGQEVTLPMTRANVKQLCVSGLDANQVYTFSVVAVRGAERSEAATAQLRTFVNSPSNLSVAFDAKKTTANLKWTNNEDKACSTRVEYAAVGDTRWTLAKVTCGGAKSLKITGLDPNKVYIFRACVQVKNDYSSWTYCCSDYMLYFRIQPIVETGLDLLTWLNNRKNDVSNDVCNDETNELIVPAFENDEDEAFDVAFASIAQQDESNDIFADDDDFGTYFEDVLKN